MEDGAAKYREQIDGFSLNGGISPNYNLVIRGYYNKLNMAHALQNIRPYKFIKKEEP